MKAGILAVVAACLVSTASLAERGPGAPEHTYRTVALSIVVPRPCVSVPASGARILLSTDKLVELSRGRHAAYQSEEERLAFIAGDRAASLLAIVSDAKDASGCAVVDLGHTGSAIEVLYLVGQLIERGEATVFREGANRAETSVTVHDYNGAASGFQSFNFVGGASFLSYPTWVA